MIGSTSISRAAEIVAINDEVVLTGEIKGGDYEKFKLVVRDLPSSTVVRLQSPGGSTLEGISIGEHIRDRGFYTFVANADCASSCALIWLSGVKRWIGTNGRVGFHQSYTVNGSNRLTPSIRGNALVGGYIGRLGYGYAAISFAIAAPPQEIRWLNVRTAQRYEISYRHGNPPGKGYAIPRRTVDVLSPEEMYSLAYERYHLKRYSEAVDLMQAAATAGYAPAQSQLGLLYENGDLVQKDPRRALKWYLRAAKQSDATGEFFAAFYFFLGEEVGEDKLEAVRLWRSAANKNDPEAEFMLGELYAMGEVFKKDLVQAEYWYRRALSHGNLDARKELQRIGAD
ncbi:MAG: hypothetical protein ABJH63_18840 [Rhizobiaceae bacterium]